VHYTTLLRYNTLSVNAAVTKKADITFPIFFFFLFDREKRKPAYSYIALITMAILSRYLFNNNTIFRVWRYRYLYATVPTNTVQVPNTTGTVMDNGSVYTGLLGAILGWLAPT